VWAPICTTFSGVAAATTCPPALPPSPPPPEYVAEGHPDKIADEIYDATLDPFLAEEPEAKVACDGQLYLL
jgi:hypothetical protein